MRHYLLTLLLMMAAMTAMGQQTVSVADARAKATAFLNRNAGAKGGTVTTDVQLAYTAQQGAETYYYVFNNGSDGKGGFVIIGGDETARTILGYSDNGTFDYATAPENMKWWLSQYEQQISAAIKNGGTTAAAKGGMEGVKSIARANIEPLVKTTWDQVAPFNTAIPKIGGNAYITEYSLATGCVATAAAQIMKYYEHPKTTSTGSHSYNITYTNAGTITFSANFGGTTYDWTNMKNSYTYNTFSGNEQGSGNASERAVATLMYHCGVAANMSYGQLAGSGSSAYDTNMGAGLVKYFDYDKSMTREDRTGYTDDQWAALIYSELEARRPVLYGGQTSGGTGHAFVCSGYQNSEGYDLFHINWGWSGNYNGYFPLQGTVNGVYALRPDGTGSGGAAAGSAYDQEQDIIIGIKPNAGGAPKVTCESLTLKSVSISPGNSLGIDMSVRNNSFLTLNFTVGLKLVNQSTSDITYLEYTSYPFENKTWGQGSAFTDYASTELTLASGTYTVYPVYKDNEGNWHPLTYDFEEPTLNVIGLDEGPIVNGAQTISNGGYVTPTSGTFTVTIWNNSNVDMEDATFTAHVWRSGFSYNIGSINTTATIPAHETQDVVFDFANYDHSGATYGEALAAGNTYFTKVYCGGSPVRESINVIFRCTAEQAINYKLSSAGWGTLCLPFSAEKPVGLTLYEVTDVNGNELVKTEADKIEMNKAYLVSGTAGTYNFSGPTTPTDVYTNGLLTGNTNSTTVYVPKDSYVLQNLPSTGLAFYKVAANNSQKCSPYKAYLTLPSGLTSLYSALLFTDSTTGIESIEATDNQQGATRKVLKNGRLTIETPQGSFTPAGARMK